MGRMPRRLGGGMGFWGMCLRGRRCGGDRGGAFCDGESLVGWDGSAKRTLDFEFFFSTSEDHCFGREIVRRGNGLGGGWGPFLSGAHLEVQDGCV